MHVSAFLVSFLLAPAAHAAACIKGRSISGETPVPLSADECAATPSDSAAPHNNGSHDNALQKRYYVDPNYIGPQFCFASDAFGSHPDIQSAAQLQYSWDACYYSVNHMIRKNDDSSALRLHTEYQGADYFYLVYWKPGCESSVTEFDAWQPIRDNPNWTCAGILRRNYLNCNNGGVGGNFQIGCVGYEFKPTKG
ncbi:hypothetical protein ACCO45_004354 [Purpureocillium lilacinum]|uniref:Uncharacterized protein n=1 Tax=Purpureocillium lilacinum TaxID=33203 RepID=A0ACC4E5B2_PURLI